MFAYLNRFYYLVFSNFPKRLFFFFLLFDYSILFRPCCCCLISLFYVLFYSPILLIVHLLHQLNTFFCFIGIILTKI